MFDQLSLFLAFGAGLLSFISPKGLTFPVLIDDNKSVMETYNINPLPTTILINPEWKIEKIITGEMSEESIKQFMEQIMPI